MSTTTTTAVPVEDRIRERMETERKDLDQRIGETRAGKTEAADRYSKALDRMNALSEKVVLADDNGKEPSQADLDDLNEAHAESLKAMHVVLAKGATIRAMQAKRDALDDEREFDRRLEQAQRLQSLRKTQTKDGSPKRPSAKDAAVTVLLQQGNAMHYREITRVAMESGLLVTSGKTPAATMNSMLSTTARDGDTFVKVAPGVFDLKDRDAERKRLEDEGQIEAGAKADAEEPTPAAKPAAKKPAAKKPRSKATA